LLHDRRLPGDGGQSSVNGRRLAVGGDGWGLGSPDRTRNQRRPAQAILTHKVLGPMRVWPPTIVLRSALQLLVRRLQRLHSGIGPLCGFCDQSVAVRTVRALRTLRYPLSDVQDDPAALSSGCLTGVVCCCCSCSAVWGIIGHGRARHFLEWCALEAGSQERPGGIGVPIGTKWFACAMVIESNGGM
jgi:hypothetical protein